VPVHTVTISHIVCTLWYTIYGIHQLLRVSASGCHPEGVITTKVYGPTCQSRFWHADLGSASSRAEPRLRCCLIYLCCNDSLRMVYWLSERCSFWPKLWWRDGLINTPLPKPEIFERGSATLKDFFCLCLSWAVTIPKLDYWFAVRLAVSKDNWSWSY
jgi:hypothetical protein